jgi:hypothetical protein
LEPSQFLYSRNKNRWEWWQVPGIPPQVRLRQEDHKSAASIGYIVRPPHLTKNKKHPKTTTTKRNKSKKS